MGTPGRPRRSMERFGDPMTRLLYSGVLALAAMAAACAGSAELAARPDEVTDFKTLYGASCAGCHGVDGRHGVAQPLNDPTYLAIVSDARLVDVISSGVRGT